MRIEKQIYNQYFQNSKKAILNAIDSFNRVYGDYNIEITLFLLSNAWELLAKSILIKLSENIYKNKQKDETIPCEKAILKLKELKEITDSDAETILQIVSLRNAAIHSILPQIPLEIQQHLLFLATKQFKDLAKKHFGKRAKDLEGSFLSLSFDNLTTYADKVIKNIAKVRKNNESKKLVWLLERGVQFVSKGRFISQTEFEDEYKSKLKILPHLEIKKYLNNVDMVKIIPFQAPKNCTADVIFRRGSKNDNTLPIMFKPSAVDKTHPYLTSEIAKKLGKTTQFIAKLAEHLKLKNNINYHQEITTSKRGKNQKYSEEALLKMKDFLEKNPKYEPDYNNKRKKKSK